MFPLNFVQLSSGNTSSSYNNNKNSNNSNNSSNNNNYDGQRLDNDQMDNTKILLFRQKIAEVDTLKKLLNNPSLSEDRRRKCYSRLKIIESAFH